MKAVLQYGASAGFRQALRDSAPNWLDIVVVDETDAAALRDELEDADVLLHVLTPVTADVLSASPKLRLVQKIGVGVNTIDLETAKSRGIAVANMPGCNSQAVAEHTLTLMLAALRRLGYLDSETRRGAGWRLLPDTYDSVSELSGKTVGFVGYGSIPQRLTAALVALGARVIYHTRRARPDGAAMHQPSLQGLLQEADIVSLHIPLMPETRGMFNREAFSMMKHNAILVNTARGELVDEAALIEALQSGKLAAAGLDVFVTEPAGESEPLLALPNVVATPHVAWLTPQTLQRSIDALVENCRRLKEGESLLNLV